MSALLLVRHGESEWNRLGRIQGQKNSPLTDVGKAQAAAIGDYLVTWLSDQSLRIYSSPLARAQQTASIIAEKIRFDSNKIQIDERLNDFDQGAIAGTYGWHKVVEEYPELGRLRLEDPISYYPPGGESGADFWSRLEDFLVHLPNDEIINLVVSHGIVNKFIRSIRRNITGPGIIALGESQSTIYRLDADQESEMDTSQNQ